MPEQPRVSVVLPAFNAERCVARAVASVREQTFGNWELIVVDDGSSDQTARAAEQAGEGDSRIRVLRQSHGGIVAALNAGLDQATGEFIARMDADDECLPRRLEAQVTLLDTRPEIEVASCRVEFQGEAHSAHGYRLHVEWMNELIEPDEIARSRFIESPVAHPSVMFRRGLIAAHGGYCETGWPEDYELWLRWMDRGVRFAKVPEVLLRWRDTPGRLSRNHAWYGEDRFYRCKCHYLARWLRRELSPDRAVYLWGAGRVTRRRFAALKDEGVVLAGFVDIDPNKTGRKVADVPVIAPEDLPGPEDCFVIAGVGTRGARDLIREFLAGRGFVEGRDFFPAA